MLIRWTVEDEIGWLMLDKPPSNTMTMDFFSELKQLVTGFRDMPSLKAVIIYGNGRHFSAGADINELLQTVDEQVMLDNYHSFDMIRQLEIPVISAIRGVCLGSAFELALSGHFRICAEDAVLGLPESTFNLMPGIGGIHSVAGLAGNAKAIELSLRGNTFTASDALDMGLVDAVTSKGELLPLSLNLARLLPRRIKMEHRQLYLHKYLKSSHAGS
jgi:enoyl-CoA hydratase/carnithine racemase